MILRHTITDLTYSPSSAVLGKELADNLDIKAEESFYLTYKINP